MTMLAPLRISIVLLLICGGIYPTLVTLVGGVAFPYQAQGSIINGTGWQPGRLRVDRPGV